jgi:hypothetical protein
LILSKYFNDQNSDIYFPNLSQNSPSEYQSGAKYVADAHKNDFGYMHQATE